MTKHDGKPNLATRPDDSLADGDVDETAPLMGSHAMVTTQMGHVTAQKVAVPRNDVLVQKRIIREAEQAGGDFMYFWTAKGKPIEGVTIDGAMILLRNWGNCSCPVEVVQETPTHWYIRATFVDYEAGFALPRLFRQRKSMDLGDKMDAARGEDIAFQIAQSKAQRNAILKAMPVGLVTAAINASKAAQEAALKDLPDRRTKAIEHWKKQGVTEAQLSAKVGAVDEGPPVPSAQWAPKDLVMLAGIWTALRNRDTTIAAEFPKDEKPTLPREGATPENEPEKPRQREPGEEG